MAKTTPKASPERPGQRKNAFAIFLDEVSRAPVTIPLLAILSGLILGGLIVALTTEDVYAAWS